MSIPVHFNGSLLNVMGGGGSGPAPPTNPITSIQVEIPDEADNALVAQLYFGTGGATTGFTSTKATFLAQNPGLTLQDFTGIAGANQRVNVSGSFTGFTVSTRSGAPSPQVSDTGYYAANFPFHASVYCTVSDGSMTITFSPSVTAVGFNVASDLGGVAGSFRAYNGVTVLTTQSFTANAVQTFDTFLGYVSS